MSDRSLLVCSGLGMVRSVKVELRMMERLSPPMLRLQGGRLELERDMTRSGASGIVIVRRSLDSIWGTSCNEWVRSRAKEC